MPAAAHHIATLDAWSRAWTGWDAAWDDGPARPDAPTKALPVEVKVDTPSRLAAIHSRQATWMDGMAERFERDLAAIVEQAQAAVAKYLREHLTLVDGAIAQTPANLNILRGLNTFYLEAMNDAGYAELVAGFTARFGEQFEFLQDTLAYLSSTMETPLPALEFSADDLKLFDSFQLSAQAQLETALELAAGRAMSQVMFAVGGLKFTDLVATLAEKFATSIPQARSLADTAVATFYRTITDRAFQLIEQDLPSQVTRYRYSGPDDSITRPFCRHLVESNRAYTREEIAEMDNHQTPVGSVIVAGGGWNCRHVFLLDVAGVRTQKDAALGEIRRQFRLHLEQIVAKWASDTPRDEHGRWTEGTGGSQHETGLTLSDSKTRAWSSTPTALEHSLSHAEAGALGERIAIAHLQSQGMKDARPLNAQTANFPVDAVGDHGVAEIKTGLVSNGASAQHWRATIGQPGVAERAWLEKASPKAKAAWNAAKAEKIIERKQEALKAIAKQVGQPMKAYTVGIILNPDTHRADIYEMPGFHSRVSWHSDLASTGYVKTVNYAEGKD